MVMQGIFFANFYGHNPIIYGFVTISPKLVNQKKTNKFCHTFFIFGCSLQKQILMGSEQLKKIVEHKMFVRVTSLMIICCSIVLGIETSFPAHLSVFQIIDYIFTTYFALEIIIRILAEPNTLNFFKLFHIEKHEGRIITFHFEEKGFWNWFDFLITAFSIFSLVVHVFEHPEFLVVGRLFRVLRILRLLEVSQELKEVERKIVSIIPTVFSFALLLGILIYIYSIIGIYLFSHHKYENADFSSLGASFLSLFQLMTLEGWVDMMYQASSHYENSWLIKGYFISFVVLTVIISFNVFVAVLTSQVQEKINAENILEEKKLLKNMESALKDNNEALSKQLIALTKEIETLRTEIKGLKD